MTERTIGFRGRFSRNVDKRKLTTNGDGGNKGRQFICAPNETRKFALNVNFIHAQYPHGTAIAIPILFNQRESQPVKLFLDDTEAPPRRRGGRSPVSCRLLKSPRNSNPLLRLEIEIEHLLFLARFRLFGATPPRVCERGRR